MAAPATKSGPPDQFAKSLRRLWSCLMVLSLLVAWSGQGASGQGVDSRLGFSHTAGQLPGLDDGYTRFNGFLPLIEPNHVSLVFADLGFVLLNENTQADGANLGLGVRAYDSVANRVYGGHFYYDYRDTGHSHYNQLSWGFESLGYMFDYRVNAYLPVGDTWNNYIDNSTSTTFIGSHLYFTDIPQEVALRGVDSEAVGLLLDQGTWQLRGGAGIYSFWHANTGVAAIGPRARLELRVADQLWINGSVQHDDEFDTTAAVSISWRYGLTRHFERCSSSESVACRLGDPVERQDQISIKRYTGGTSTIKAVTTTGGRAYTFHHVSSEAEPGGDGSIESPTNSLAAASHQSEDIVLVHGGSQFIGEQFVTSTEGQRVLAEGVPHTLETQAGTIVLPEVGNGASPVIMAGLGDAITIAADGVEVSGFYLDYSNISYPLYPFNTLTDDTHGELIDIDIDAIFFAPGTGIVATNVNNIRVERNTVVGASTGIKLQNVHGVSLVQANTVEFNTGYGVWMTGGFTGTIAANSLNNNAVAGLVVYGELKGDVVGNVATRNSTVAWGGLGGIVLGGNVDGSVSGNVANENQGFGIHVTGTVSGDFKGNSAEGIAPSTLMPIYFFDDDMVGEGLVDGINEADDIARNGTEDSIDLLVSPIPWFAADLPGYDPNEHAVMSGIETQSFPNLLTNEQRRIGIPMFVRGTVGGQVSGNVASVTAPMNLDPNVFVEYPAMVPHE